MLTQEKVLTFIKTKLASPYIPLELNDEQILNIVRLQTIPFFSRYIPDTYELTIDTNDETYQTDIDNEFKIIDPDGLEIYYVKQILIESNDLVLYGHPLVGLIGSNQNDVIDYIIHVENSMTSYKFGMLNYTIQWLKPNIIRIVPEPVGKIKVIYEREHHPDFHTIPLEFKTHFLNLAYADIAEHIAKIRRQFREFQTPFGTIELDPDILLDESRDIRERFLEEMRLYNPPILIDRG